MRGEASLRALVDSGLLPGIAGKVVYAGRFRVVQSIGASDRIPVRIAQIFAYLVSLGIIGEGSGSNPQYLAASSSPRTSTTRVQAGLATMERNWPMRWADNREALDDAADSVGQTAVGVLQSPHNRLNGLEPQVVEFLADDRPRVFVRLGSAPGADLRRLP